MERVVLDLGAVQRLLTSEAGPVGRDLLRRAVRVDGTAKRLCPVDTGRLRSSIAHELARDSRGLVAFVGTNVDYAIFVELGTRYQQSQPFLRPALRSAA